MILFIYAYFFMYICSGCLSPSITFSNREMKIKLLVWTGVSQYTMERKSWKWVCEKAREDGKCEVERWHPETWTEMEKPWKILSYVQLNFNGSLNSLYVLYIICTLYNAHECKTGKTLTSQFGAIFEHFMPVAITNSMSM